MFSSWENMGRVPWTLLSEIEAFLRPDVEEEDMEVDGSYPADDSHGARTMTMSSSSSNSTGGVEDWEGWGEDSQFLPTPTPSLTHPTVPIPPNKESQPTSNWLQHCMIQSVSTTDVIAFGLNERLVIVECKVKTTASDGNRDGSGADGDMSFRITAKKDDYCTPISSICCLPIASHRKTETRAHDWVSVVLGFADGEIHFLTHDGQLLLKQHFSTSPVLSFHMNTVLHNSQEFSILQRDCLVTIEGLGLYTALRTYRNQIAANAIPAEALTHLSHLNYKKSFLAGLEDLSEHASCGALKQNRFDQLEAASSLGGSDARPSNSLPHFSTYCVTGPRPFLAFYWQEEGASSAGLTEALVNLAGKVKSSVTSQFFGWGSKSGEAKRQDPLEVRPTKMSARNFILDPGRQGERLYLAPYGHIAAVVDAQARVFLVNVETREVLRVWKGYRDAECGWVVSEGEIVGGNGKSSRVLYLVIFAPRRGLLEIWTMQNGPRVAAYNVDKKGRLLELRIERSLGGGFSDDPLTLSQHPCQSVCFLNSSGKIASLKVNFHAALQDETTSQTHDLHILRKFRAELETFVKQRPSGDEIPFSQSMHTHIEILRQFKTLASLRQAIDIAIFQIEALPLGAVAYLVDQVMKLLDPSSTEGSTKHFLSVGGLVLRTQVLAYQQLINVYALLSKCDSEDVATEEEQVEEDVAKLLFITESELEDYVNILTKSSIGVSGQPLSTISLPDFLRCYDFSSCFASVDADLSQETTKTNGDYMILNLSKKVGAQSLAQMGELVFSPLLKGWWTLGFFQKSLLPALGLSSESLLELLCEQWLGHSHSYSVYPLLLLQLLVVIVGGRGVGEWAEVVEKRLRGSWSMAECFSLSLIVRAVVRKEALVKSEEDNWEQVEVCAEKWDLLLSHFRCLCLLHQWGGNNNRTMSNNGGISLEELLAKGRGYYRERVAQFIQKGPLSAEDASAILRSSTESGQTGETSSDVENLLALQKCLPLSLSEQFVLAEGAWEGASGWSKEVDALGKLEKAVVFMSKLEHPRLQMGICAMIWDTFIFAKFKSLCLLVEKVGKFPKDRLLRKEVGIGENGISTFAELCLRILTILQESNRYQDYSSQVAVEYEDFVDNLFAMTGFSEFSGASRESLVEMAVGVRAGNFFLIKHHVQLALVVKLMLENRSIRPARPLSLFDNKGKKAFFASFSSHPLLPMAQVDPDTKSSRQIFCGMCISERINSFSMNEYDTSPGLTEIFQLAEEWELELGKLKQKEVIGLYRIGMDSIAEKRLSLVEEKGNMGEELLNFFGSLLAARIEHDQESPSTQEMISVMTNRTRNWLQSLPQDNGHVIARNSDSLRRLLDNASGCLTQKNTDIAEELKQLVAYC